ncbi:MAG: hypothetical protein AMS18_13045 [Gemmatimonas sp. SG8_17]|nr:MAG: hypothetical protein AMS18_13045 [Gemmatimonas sp. SG8_17]
MVDWKSARIAVVLALALSAVGFLPGQAENPLLQRWVGTHQGRPLFLDFYSDTMLVVNDVRVADFYTTRDSIVVFGDTSFAVHYRFALDRLLLRTEEGNVITMASQGPLARPLWGHWLGEASRVSGRQIELRLFGNGTAWWRWLPGGQRTDGEWDRFSRIISFTWLPDSTTWTGLYDPMVNQLVFEETEAGSGVTVLHRFYRRPTF